MSYPFGRMQKQYCYKDYVNLPADKKYEVIDGVLFAMTPSPSTQHQRVLRKLFVYIANFLAGKNCEVFCAPYDVLLPDRDEDPEDIKNIVQPDIMVVCDKSKLTESYCIGPPDFIIEIVSPSSPSTDYVKKLHLYEKHKVKEYWIVNYIRQEIMVFRLKENGEYEAPEIYSNEEIVSGVIQGLHIPLNYIFA